MGDRKQSDRAGKGWQGEEKAGIKGWNGLE